MAEHGYRRGQSKRATFQNAEVDCRAHGHGDDFWVLGTHVRSKSSRVMRKRYVCKRPAVSGSLPVDEIHALFANRVLLVNMSEESNAILDEPETDAEAC